MKAYLKNERISPKKLRVIAEIIRGKEAKEAQDILKFMPKKGAKIMYKVLSSAIANATHNDNAELDSLKIHTVSVLEGVVYKRGHAVGRGRYHKLLKRTSNVVLELENS